MWDLARDIVGSQPILALFLAIGLGYLVGQINIFGFSLGVGAVLFVGLAIGGLAPKASITGPISLIGLIMFLYGIGILYGREFFEGMTGASGRKYNLLALVGVGAGLLVALGLGQAFADVRELELLEIRHAGLSVAERAVDGVQDPVQVGKVVLLQPRWRVRSCVAADAQHRRLQVVEAVLLHQRRELGPKTAGPRCFVRNHATAGLLDRRDDGVDVDRHDAAQIDDLGIDA